MRLIDKLPASYALATIEDLFIVDGDGRTILRYGLDYSTVCGALFSEIRTTGDNTNKALLYSDIKANRVFVDTTKFNEQ